MPDAQPFLEDRSSEALMRAFRERTAELEVAQQQVLAFRLESSVRAAYVAEMQQIAEEALSRAERAEHQLHLLRLAHAHEARPAGASPEAGHVCPDPLPLISAAISALQASRP